MRKGTKTRDVARPGSLLWTYLMVVTVAGLGVLGLAISWIEPSHLAILAAQPAFWMVAVLIVLGELRPIVSPGSREEDAVRVSTTFSFALLLYVGLPIALIAQSVATVARCVLTKKSPSRSAIDVAQQTLSLAAAAGVLGTTGVHASPTHPWVPQAGDLLSVALAALAYFVVNDVLATSSVVLLERTPLLGTLRADLGYQVIVNLAVLGCAPLVVVTMERSAAFVPLFALPLIAIYTNASSSSRREHEAFHDDLTGLANRQHLARLTHQALRNGQRAGDSVGLVLVDLDRFKEVNDTLGHATGDRLLCLVGDRLRQAVRPGDDVARLSGDEFGVLLPTIHGPEAARDAARRVRAAFNEPFRLDGMVFELEASIGIALAPQDAEEFEPLLRRADVAMHLAKESRTGIEMYHPEKDRNSPPRLGLLAELRRAIDNGQLELHYQPKIALADRSIVGVEGLLRWRHPRRGFVPPDEFVPFAEQTHLMRDLTRHVVECALAQASRWWSEGYRVHVAVNISARDLFDSGLAETVADGLSRHGVPADVLQVEITERVLVTETAHAADTIAALADLGVPLSLDDFGTGYSSLLHLRQLPVREIKVDRSFISRLAHGTDDAVIVRSIIDLAKALGLRSVAEGVETSGAARMLRHMGCDAAQGWHFSRPMKGERATKWLGSRWMDDRSVVCGGMEAG